jgi:hypothetical protein
VPKDGSRPPLSGNGRASAVAVGAMPRATSMARKARMPRISRRPIPTPDCFEKCRQGGQTRSHGAPDDGEPQRTHLPEANGTAERTIALDMIDDNAKPGSTVGGAKSYDTADFVAGCRERRCTPHVAHNDTNRCSAIELLLAIDFKHE